MKTQKILTALSVLGLGAASQGAIVYNIAGASYAQNFDSLAASGTEIVWANDSTIAGWYLFRQDGVNPPVAITTYNAGTGSSNVGSFYSFGDASNSERALGGVGTGTAYFGSPASGAVAGWIAVALKNSTSSTLDKFTVRFDGEQWRNGGNTTAHTMVFEYGFGASFDAVASWNAPGGTFDWSSPVATATAGAVNGNTDGLVSGRGGTVTGLSWSDGQTLWLRWIERNDTGNDHGLAIDNFSFQAVPEPHEYAAMGALGLLGFAAWRRSRKA